MNRSATPSGCRYGCSTRSKPAPTAKQAGTGTSNPPATAPETAAAVAATGRADHRSARGTAAVCLWPPLGADRRGELGEAGRDSAAGAGAPHRPTPAITARAPSCWVAPPPPALIPKGWPARGCWRSATAKFCDALPLYRQELRAPRGGAVRRTGPQLRAGPKLQIDPAGAAGRANTTISYLWVARGGLPSEPVLVYRSAAAAGTSLPTSSATTRAVPTYEAYGPCPGVRHVGCWSHAAAVHGRRAGRAAALQALSFKLYRAESVSATDPAGSSPSAVPESPVLKQLHLWLLRKHDQVLRRSARRSPSP